MSLWRGRAIFCTHAQIVRTGKKMMKLCVMWWAKCYPYDKPYLSTVLRLYTNLNGFDDAVKWRVYTAQARTPNFQLNGHIRV